MAEIAISMSTVNYHDLEEVLDNVETILHAITVNLAVRSATILSPVANFTFNGVKFELLAGFNRQGAIDAYAAIACGVRSRKTTVFSGEIPHEKDPYMAARVKAARAARSV